MPRFKSGCRLHNASVAQLVEQGTENPRVVGSIPTGGTIFKIRCRYADLAHLVERDLAKVEVAGSNPVIRSNGSLAQLGEHLPYKQRVRGSSPLAPTTRKGKCGSVVQLVRTLACHARGRGFESHPNRHHAAIAQLVERILGKDEVGRSNRLSSSIYGPLVKRLRHRPLTAKTWVRFPYGSPYTIILIPRFCDNVKLRRVLCASGLLRFYFSK